MHCPDDLRGLNGYPVHIGSSSDNTLVKSMTPIRGRAISMGYRTLVPSWLKQHNVVLVITLGD